MRWRSRRSREGRLAASDDGCVGRQVGGEQAVLRRHRRQLGLRDQHRLQAAEAVGDGARRAVRGAVAHQVEAGGVDQPAVAVGHERAGAGQERIAARILHDEEAVAIDGEIGGGRRVFQVALLRGRIADAGGDAARRVVAGDVGDDQRRELGARPLVAGGAGVGDVVGDRRQAVGLRIHSGHAGPHHSVEAHRQISAMSMGSEISGIDLREAGLRRLLHQSGEMTKQQREGRAERRPPVHPTISR